MPRMDDLDPMPSRAECEEMVAEGVDTFIPNYLGQSCPVCGVVFKTEADVRRASIYYGGKILHPACYAALRRQRKGRNRRHAR